MNKVVLMGRMVADADINEFGKGKNAGLVGSFRLAVRDGVDADGNERTQFIQCTAWNGLAEIVITIAGVSKKDGAKELESIDNFKNGFIFKNAGGLESLYNDNVDIVLDVGGQKIRCRDNLCLRESTYTIGLSADYERLLNGKFKPKYMPFGDINKLFK